MKATLAVGALLAGLAHSAWELPAAEIVRSNPLANPTSIAVGFGNFANVPMNSTAAKALGWAPTSGSSCIQGLGVEWSIDGSYERHTPFLVYYTYQGQLSGFGTLLYADDLYSNLIQAGFYKNVGDDVYRIAVGTRDPRAVCGSSVFRESIGDRVTINPDAVNFPVPLNDTDAANQMWTKGSFINKMGTHWSYDLSSAPKMSWEASNFLPLVPMYYRGQLAAVFFASTNVQQSVIPLSSNMWDKVCIPNFLMCKNWCDSTCSWTGTLLWSTMHVFFGDYDRINECQSTTCCD